MDKGLAYIGEGIAFAGLCIASSWLEIHDKPARGLWIVVVIWAFCFGPATSSNKSVERTGSTGEPKTNL